MALGQVTKGKLLAVIGDEVSRLRIKLSNMIFYFCLSHTFLKGYLCWLSIRWCW